MKRLVNVRIPILLAIALVAGIAVGYLFIYNNISLFYLTAVVPVTAVIIILFTLFSKGYAKVIITLITALLFVCGAVSGFVKLDNYGRSELAGGDVYTISARVCEKGKTENGEYVILNDLTAGDKKISGKMIVYLGKTYGDFCDVGYEVNFTSEINHKDTFPYGKLNYYAQKNVKYSCNIYGGLSAKYGYSFFGSIHSVICKTLYDNLDSDTASIAFAILTGNTQGVDENAMDSFRYGGIAHIFAVSGLHIGILYGALYWLFKKLKLNKYARTALCILPLFFYVGICGFTLSSIRAAVMCTVSALALLAHKKYDSLNALALAVIINLLITPISLFSVGFQLSVCATGSIILLSKSFTRPFKKIPKKVSGAIGVSIAAQAGTMPVMLANFGYLSGAGLLMNIIILPLISLVYVILFVSTLIATVLPFTSAILPYGALPLQFLVSLFINAGFEKALVSGFGAGAFLPVFYLGLFALSDKFNINLWHRMTAVACSVIFLCTFVLVNTFAPFSGYKIIVTADYHGCGVVIKSNEGTVLIVTESISSSAIVSTLNDYYANNLSAIIILGGEQCALSYGKFDFSCKDVYVHFSYIDVQPYPNCTIHYEKEFTVNGVNFSFADGYSINANCDGIDVAVCAGDKVPFESCNLLITDSAGSCKRDYIAGFNQRNYEYNVYDCGNLIFKACDGQLK